MMGTQSLLTCLAVTNRGLSPLFASITPLSSHSSLLLPTISIRSHAVTVSLQNIGFRRRKATKASSNNMLFTKIYVFK